MKKHQWLFLIIVVLAICITINWNFGLQEFDNSGSTTYKDDGYSVESFYVDVNVNENNSYDISETIQVDFASLTTAGASHGIYRYLDLNPQAIRVVDEKVVKNYYKIDITSINVTGYDFVKEITDDDMLVLIIGDEDTLVNGQTLTYNISYKYSVGDDRYDSFDDFYFNIIGSGWTTDINNVSFKITFPTSIADNETYFYSGLVGGTEMADITLSSSTNNTIQGTFNDSIAPGEALTIRTILPNGYFSGIEEISTIWSTLGIVFICISIIILIGFGTWGFSQLKVAPVVNFYPPEGISPFKLKAIFSPSYLSNRDLAAMIIYWANKGYLKISQTDNKDPVITKIKDMPETEKSREKELFNYVVKLYEGGSLNKSDYKTRANIGSSIRSENVLLKAEVGKRSTSKSVLFTIIQGIIWFVSVITPVAGFWFIASADTAMATGIIILVSGFAFMFLSVSGMRRLDLDFSLSKKILVGSILFIVTLFFTNFIFFCLKDSTIISPVVKYLVAVSIPIMMICIGKTPQYPEKLRKDLGQIYGFANNLLLVHEDRLKVLLKENPSYFYDILPYTYVLGINKKFTKKFENIALDPPRWGDENGLLTYVVIVSMCNNLNTTLSSLPMKTKNSGTGGTGGGFGGGFSGGGFGGGGGGRW